MDRNLYNGLVVQGKAQVTRIKYWGMWNNNLENLKDGKELSFPLPAVLFEFVPNTVDTVGNGVQVFDPLVVRVHTLHEFYDATDGNLAINLDVFDLEKDVHSAYQLFQVTGTGYGSSPLNRTAVEIDSDHDNIYHYVSEYTTTWTDNSQAQPKGGYDINPPLQAAITESKIPLLPTPAINVAPSSLAFGNVTVGMSKILTFTIDGNTLPADPLIISTSDLQFLVSLSVSYSSRVVMPTTGGIVISTTINVKFTPLVSGAVSAYLNYGVPGLNNLITLSGTGI